MVSTLLVSQSSVPTLPATDASSASRVAASAIPSAVRSTPTFEVIASWSCDRTEPSTSPSGRVT